MASGKDWDVDDNERASGMGGPGATSDRELDPDESTCNPPPSVPLVVLVE
jgi:hypothetical protein